ncbi:uncharacterized protein LOC134195423 [Corticium candelabrum]|uniref:uncharacterized protein LOC134195423 n=1 Tax=Corticium candelabrum TaxID=121492 RepID=UPI002E257716|nr:uncharacterized protein LOC134195423 [Corticium candelabrum]
MGTDNVSTDATVFSGDTDTTNDTNHNKFTTYRIPIRPYNRSHARRTRYQHRLCRPPVGSKVVNLSNCNLSTAELSLLDKGLTFIPQTYTTGNKQLLKDFDDFARTLRIQYLYHDSPNTIYDPFRLKSTRPYLNSGNKILETYINNTRSQLYQLHSTRPKRDNLTPSERRALVSIQKRTDIIIKKADKGNCVTVEDTQDYIRTAEKHLSDETKYEQLPFNTTDITYDKIQSTVLSHYLLRNLTRTQFQYVSRPKEHCRTQLFYTLKKIHKDTPEIRPIVSGCLGPTELISAITDYYLQPILQETQTYLKDTGHILSLLRQQEINEHSYLVTIDVVGLYPSIPHDEGIKIVSNQVQEHYKNKGLTDMIRDFLTHILKDNVFQFNNKYYRQIHGTAMGTKAAPTYACLYMWDLEIDFFKARILKPKPTLWYRYIDDIIMIWDDSHEELMDFLEELNHFNPHIKYTWTISQMQVTFLDLDLN